MRNPQNHKCSIRSPVLKAAQPPKPPGEEPRSKIIKIPEDRIKVPDQGPPKKPPAPEIRIPPKDEELPPIIPPPGPPEERVCSMPARPDGVARLVRRRLAPARPQGSAQARG